MQCPRCKYECNTKKEMLRHINRKIRCQVNEDKGGKDLSVIELYEFFGYQKTPNVLKSFDLMEPDGGLLSPSERLVLDAMRNCNTLIDNVYTAIHSLFVVYSKVETTDISIGDFCKEMKEKIDRISVIIDGAIQEHARNDVMIVNELENEDISYITPDFKRQCIFMGLDGIFHYIKHIHFNPEKPHNRNIVYKNGKDKTVLIYKEGEWYTQDAFVLIDELATRYGRLLYRYLFEHLQNDKDMNMAHFRDQKMSIFGGFITKQPDYNLKRKNLFHEMERFGVSSSGLVRST